MPLSLSLKPYASLYYVPPSTGLQVYAAEMSPPKRRGLLGAFFQISVVIGVFLSYVMGTIPGLLYYHSALVIIVILIVFEVLMFIPKESPRWLLMKNHEYAAKMSLLWLFKSEESVNQLTEEIENSLTMKKLPFSEKMKVFKQTFHFYSPLPSLSSTSARVTMLSSIMLPQFS